MEGIIKEERELKQDEVGFFLLQTLSKKNI